MKKYSHSLALLIASTSFAVGAPVVHWKLDEASGTVASDSSGNVIEGTWEGTAGSPGWMPTDGVDGGSVLFSGADADTFINDTFTAITETPFTISSWVKTTTTGKRGMVYLGDGTTGNQYYLSNVQGGTGRTTARNGTERTVAGAIINDGEWHNVVSVYTSPTERSVYVDGIFGGTQTVEVLAVNLNRFGIGGLTRNTPHAPVDLLEGQLDDVALWDRAFSAADAAAVSGLGALGAGNAADVELLVDAFTAQTTATIQGVDWEYATGLTGVLGTNGGSLGSRTGFVVMDDLGNGMKMSPIPGNPVVDSFTVAPETVFLGEAVTFEWAVQNSTSLSIDQGVGAVTNPSGSLEFTPTETATFTLTATNANGSSFGEVNVTVIPEPIIDTFEGTPTAIFVGESVELAWAVQNFNTLEIDQEVGVVTGAAGTVMVSPTETTTYTFTATNDTTSSTAEVTVKVFPTPPARELLLHWPLDEGVGTTTADLAGANPGVFNEVVDGAPTWTEGFLGGGALTFPNLNGVSVRAAATLVEEYPFSMAGWVKVTGTGNDTWAVLGTGVGNQYHSMRVLNGAARIMTRNGGNFEQGGPGLADDQWHSMVAVYAHPASMSLYVDGVFVGTRTSDSGDFITPDRFAIGALDRTDDSIVDAFDGSVDDVSFWRGLLSDRDAAALHGGASGLGLNASDIAAILTGFESQETVNAADARWSPTTGLIGAVGETSGSLADTPTIILDDSGNGMMGVSTAGILVTDITRDASGTTLTWESVPGATYIVQFSPDLVDWSDEVDDGVISGGATTTFTDSDSQRLTLPVGFYRVVR